MSSIVERLASRSLSGRDLGIDVHRHTTELLHFFWKNIGTVRCYTHFLERRLLEDEEYTLIQDFMFKTGFSGACECLSKWLPGWHFRPCPFWTRGHNFRRRYRLSSLTTRPTGYCQCPLISMIADKWDVSTTIFCLTKHSRISSKVPNTPTDVLLSRSFLLPAHS